MSEESEKRLRKIEARWAKKPPTNKPVRVQDRDDVAWLLARVGLLEDYIRGVCASSTEQWVHDMLGELDYEEEEP